MKKVYLSFLFALVIGSSYSKTKQQFYQLTVYRIALAEESMVDRYFQEAYIPALHRMGIKSIGAFKTIPPDTSETIQLYVLIPLKSLEQINIISKKLKKDKLYNVMASEFTQAAYSKPPYLRKEIILLKAFKDHPILQTPSLTNPKEDRVYELRSYESATEKLADTKIHMFNEGKEIELFKKLNFNAVFYGEVIAGSKMPNLMCLTTFNSLAERDERWSAFSQHPDWLDLSGKVIYENTVYHMDRYLLQPTPYSDY